MLDCFQFEWSYYFFNPGFLFKLRYVEEYRMSDVERELGLDRDNLIELAMLLGSDYTEVRGYIPG